MHRYKSSQQAQRKLPPESKRRVVMVEVGEHVYIVRYSSDKIGPALTAVGQWGEQPEIGIEWERVRRIMRAIQSGVDGWVK